MSCDLSLYGARQRQFDLGRNDYRVRPELNCDPSELYPATSNQEAVWSEKDRELIS